jgi:hypothetical protein
MFHVQWLKGVVPGGPVVNFRVEHGAGGLRCHVCHGSDGVFKGDVAAAAKLAATLSAQQTAVPVLDGATFVCIEGEVTARLFQGRFGQNVVNLDAPVPSLI